MVEGGTSTTSLEIVKIQEKNMFLEQLDESVVYVWNGILGSHETEEIQPFATTWMTLEDIMLCEIGQKNINTVRYKFYV